jgi:hypothetical protein
MQQYHARQLVFRIGYSAIIKRCNHDVSSAKNKTFGNEHHDNTLICPKWEEAIIKEDRKSHLPYDIMQKDTIDIINKKNNTNQQNLFPERVTESSY